MRTLYLLVIALFLTIATAAQQQELDTRKFIEVTGSAEMNILPDQIELEIRLLEYDRSGKKVKLDDINNEFYRILKKNHVDTARLTFQDLNSNDGWYWWYWWSHRHDYYQLRTVNLKLSSSTNILKLVEDLNEKWVQDIRISKSTHSKIYEYRKQVKTEAAKMAKEKATYLLESMGEKLGGVLAVTEVPDQLQYNPWWYNSGSLMSNSNIAVNNGAENHNNSISNVAEIKLRFEVKMKFAIQ